MKNTDEEEKERTSVYGSARSSNSSRQIRMLYYMYIYLSIPRHHLTLFHLVRIHCSCVSVSIHISDVCECARDKYTI